MSAEIIPFDYSGKTIRVIMDESGEPWWIASDACNALGLTNVSQAVSRLSNDEKNNIILSDVIRPGKPSIAIVSEPGLYKLIFRSKMKQAVKFQRWVYHDVLPAIRKTGTYSVQPVQPDHPALPQTYKEALIHLVAQVEKTEALQIENKELAPKAKVYDFVSASKGLVCISDAAKVLNIPPRTFFAFLSRDGIIFMRRGRWVPYALYEQKGWFEVKMVPSRDGESRSYRQTFITPLGVNKLRERYGPVPAQQDLFG